MFSSEWLLDFFLHCSVLLPYNSMFLHLSSIHWSLASSHFFCDVFMQRFEFFFHIFFHLPPFFPWGPKRPQPSTFVLFSFRVLVFIPLLLLYFDLQPTIPLTSNLFWIFLSFSMILAATGTWSLEQSVPGYIFADRRTFLNPLLIRM